MLIKFDSRHAMGTFHGIHGSLPALLEQWRLGASDAEHRANWALWVSHTYIDKRDRVHRAHDRLAMLSDACARADRVAVHPSLPMHKVIPVLRTNAVGHWKRVFHLIERTLRSLSAPPPVLWSLSGAEIPSLEERTMVATIAFKIFPGRISIFFAKNQKPLFSGSRLKKTRCARRRGETLADERHALCPLCVSVWRVRDSRASCEKTHDTRGAVRRDRKTPALLEGKTVPSFHPF